MALRKILKQKVYHNGTSMVVLKPGDKHEVPERLVQTFIDEGVIAKPAEDAAAGAPAGEGDEFAMKHLGFGKYEITGPGVPEDTVIQGKKDAEAMLAALRNGEKLLQPVEGHAASVLVQIGEGTWTVTAPWLDQGEAFDNVEAAEAREAELCEAGPPDGWQPEDAAAGAPVD